LLASGVISVGTLLTSHQLPDASKAITIKGK
jgi:hypothetical protein